MPACVVAVVAAVSAACLFASTSVCSALASVTNSGNLVLKKLLALVSKSIAHCDRSGMPVNGVMAIYKALDFKITYGMR